MPQELVDYLNDRLRGERVRFLPEDPLVWRNGAAEARFGGLTLGSAFQPLFRPALSRRVAAHEALLRARDRHGMAIAPPAVFAGIGSGQALVYVDRLCRIVHMLNFLTQPGPIAGLLILNVTTRHLLEVPDSHGAFFESLLQRCGLFPDQVVIDLDRSAASRWHVAAVSRAIRAYQARGYRVAIDDDGTGVALPGLRRLAPDLVRVPAASIAAERPATAARPLDALHAAGFEVIASHVRSASDLTAARRNGASWAQGHYLGAPTVPAPAFGTSPTSAPHGARRDDSPLFLV